MRTLVIVMLLSLAATQIGCGSGTTSAVKAADGVWESALAGSGAGVEVFNFITSFSVGSTGSLSVSYFSFLTTGPCFPVSGDNASGSFNVTATGTSPTANFQFTVQSGGSSLAMTGTATGTTDSSGNTTWSKSTGTWTLTGGTGCSSGSGTFTMTRTGS
jgi:hypothetical protein